MSVYKCSICGYEYDEKNEIRSFDKIRECPICRQDKSVFRIIKEDKIVKKEPKKEKRKN